MPGMSIGDFARASGLTPKALRLYDRMGLLRPATTDEHNGYRYYDEAQLERARLVARLRLIGMPLDRIRQLTSLPEEARTAALQSYWRQLEADHNSRRDRMALLLAESSTKELSMILNQSDVPQVGQRSGIGHRAAQQDAVIAGSRVFAVADGFGAGADIAEAVLGRLRGLDDLHGTFDPVTLLDDTVTQAAAVAAEHPGSGTTLTVLLLGERHAAIAHVGDSRVLLVRDGSLERLTRDHTVVQSLVDEGRLTPEEARAHDDRALIIRAIAVGAPGAPDISVHPVQPGDRFVLTTDGVHGVLAGAPLADLLISPVSPSEVASAVEKAVLDAGAPDNYAILVVDLPALS